MSLRQHYIDNGTITPPGPEVPVTALDRYLATLPTLELDDVGRARALRPLTPEEELEMAGANRPRAGRAQREKRAAR